MKEPLDNFSNRINPDFAIVARFCCQRLCPNPNTLLQVGRKLHPPQPLRERFTTPETQPPQDRKSGGSDGVGE